MAGTRAVISAHALYPLCVFSYLAEPGEAIIRVGMIGVALIRVEIITLIPSRLAAIRRGRIARRTRNGLI